MPVQQSKTTLMARLGTKLAKAHEQHRNDETEYNQFADLPGGIRNGVAQLETCKFDVYKSGDNEGQFYFMAVGIVQTPETHQGIRVAGLRTQIMEPMCDTPKATGKRKTLSDHLKFVYNELRKLGVDTSNLELEELEATVAALEEEKPFFRFSTRTGKPTPQYPDPKVFHSWDGVVDDFDPESVEGTGAYGQVSDDSTTTDETEDEAAEEAPPPAKPTKTLPPTKLAKPGNNGNGSAPAKPSKAPAPTPPVGKHSDPAVAKAADLRKAAVEPPPAPVKGKPGRPPMGKRSDPAKAKPAPEPLPEPQDPEDLDVLAESAEGGDTEAQQRLSDLATEAGIDESIIAGAESWEELVGLIRGDDTPPAAVVDISDGEEKWDEAGDALPQEQEVLSTPEVGDVVSYIPVVKGKKAKDAVDCEVMEVDEDAQTLTLKNLTNPKIVYKKVPASDVES